MRFVNNCTAALATSFTEKYLSTQSFDPATTSLPTYLESTGILLSMCIDGTCDDSEYVMNHLSGSWIQNATTGPRVFDNEGVGVILDPTAVTVRCLYPLDAATAGREQGGCGPGTWGEDLDWRVRWWIYWRKISKFGFKTKWQDIPCSKLLDVPEDEAGPPLLMDHNNTWWSSAALLAHFLESTFGHPVCYDDITPNFDDLHAMLVYAGPIAWMPHEWQDCTNSFSSIIHQHSTSLGIWNEIVMDRPSDMRSVIQAVFYINPRNREQAFYEAERLGRKPVLAVDPFDLQNLFQCPVINQEDEDMATIE